MDYNKALVKMKINRRINDTFLGIIKDLPLSEFAAEKNTLIVQNKNSLMTYEQFYNYVYRIVLEYVPREGENPLMKAIKMLPRTIKNVQRIKQNNDIIEFQKEILDKYFYNSGADNIKEKLVELEENINLLIAEDEIEILEDVLTRFDDRMHKGMISDLEKLSVMLKNR